jgi:hypothetical protein
MIMNKILKFQTVNVALAAFAVIVLLSSCVGTNKGGATSKKLTQNQPKTSPAPIGQQSPTPTPGASPVASNSPMPSESPVAPLESVKPEVMNVPVSIAAVTSFRGIVQELSAESGVTPAPAAAVTAFNTVQSSLTASGEATSISPDMTGAFFELGTRFCGAAVTRELALAANSPQRVLFPNVNSAGTPAQGVRANVAAFVTRLTQRFWQRNPTQAELTRLDSFQAGLTVANSAAGNQDLATALCSVVAGALQGFLSI